MAEQNRSITPEDRVLIDEALIKTKGNRDHAAAVLGWEKSRFNSMLFSDAILRAKWMREPDKDIEVTPAAEIHRPEMAVPLPAEKEIVVAITKEDAVLQKGWKRLGFDQDERKFLAGLQATYAGNLRSTMDLAYGGAAHANTRLLLVLEKLVEKIEDIQNHPENYHRVYTTEFGERESKGPDEYLKEFYDLFVSVSGELRKMGDSVTKANEMRLKMARLEMEHRSKKKTEAGWETSKPAEKT